MSKKKKDNDSKIAGTIGTIVVHAILLLVLIFTGISTIIPDTEEGLSVNYGTDMNLGDGLFEPAPQSAIEDQLVEEPKIEPVQPVSPPPAPAEPDIAEEELETQDIEESLAIKKAKEEAEKKRKEEEKRLAEEKRKQEEEAKRIAEEKRKAEEKKKAEEAKKQQIANALKGAFSTSGQTTNTSSSGQGNTGTAGNKGNPFGDANSNSYEGGGSGNGHSYSLGGRSLQGGLPTPQYNRNEEGVIVVSIEVNPAGTVVSAKAGALGTTIIDASLRKEAEKAAMKAKFNAIGGTTLQSGTITYRYKLN